MIRIHVLRELQSRTGEDLSALMAYVMDRAFIGRVVRSKICQKKSLKSPLQK